MINLTETEKRIFNGGERLIPRITHNDEERKRHYESYAFFLEQIKKDLPTRSVSILDLGCGVGWGCSLLSTIPNSSVVGIDNSFETIEYAKKNYPSTNIEYRVADLTTFISIMNKYDYVVSRGVFEHLANGLELVSQVKFIRGFYMDVPYNEKPGNKHHLLTGLTEKDFKGSRNVKFFYEDMNGTITPKIVEKPNMLMCVYSKRNL